MEKLVQSGDVYICNLGEQRGSIQGGIRPCIIICNNKAGAYSPIIHCVPLTKIDKDFPLHYILKKEKYPILEFDSSVLCEQFNLINKYQLVYKLGRIDFGDLYNIVNLTRKNLPF